MLMTPVFARLGDAPTLPSGALLMGLHDDDPLFLGNEGSQFSSRWVICLLFGRSSLSANRFLVLFFPTKNGVGGYWRDFAWVVASQDRGELGAQELTFRHTKLLMSSSPAMPSPPDVDPETGWVDFISVSIVSSCLWEGTYCVNPSPSVLQ